MSTHDLATLNPARDEYVYLDTSALYVLAFARGLFDGGPAIPAVVFPRLNPLLAFLGRAADAGARVRTSILALEEIAATVRNETRHKAAVRAGYKSWREFRREDVARSEAAAATAKANMIQMLVWAVSALDSAGALVECVGAVGDPVGAARARRESHQQLLDTHAVLDPMDALHIVFGTEIGANSFVTFDAGWGVVPAVRAFGI